MSAASWFHYKNFFTMRGHVNIKYAWESEVKD